MIALVGNPNSGKSSIFNTITNSNIKVGNYPGITVDLKKGIYKNKVLVDLPGIYSLDSYTEEEKITTKFLKDNKIEMIINVIDINNLNRSLYLTLQLISLNIPMLIVINKVDKKSMLNLNISKLEEILNLKVIAISSKKNLNIDDLKENILSIQKVSGKYFDYRLNKEESIINRYNVIDKICKDIKYKTNVNNNYLEKILLNRYLALIISIFIFFLMYFIGINIIGNNVINMIEKIILYFEQVLNDMLYYINASTIFKDLIMKGIFPGISSLLTFIPQIIILIFLLSLLEDSGYITYLSLIYHSFLKRIGLSGKSFLPLLFSFNCSVVGIISTRIIKSKKERLKTSFFIPLIPCSAKMSLIIFITSTFFKNSFLIFISFYILSIIIIIIISLIFKKEKDELILELPNIKIPSFKIAIKNSFSKIKSFIFKISTIILFTSIINFFLISFDFSMNYNVEFENSILYSLMSNLSILVKPFIGKSDIKILLSILSGIIAKEQVISTISILGSTLNTLTSYTFCIFNILTIPCINTLTCIKKEYGIKILLIYLLAYLLIAYFISIIIYRLLLIL